jgi:hypothetical protein
MTLLEFIKEIPFITIFLVGFGIFELVQLILKKREPTKLNIIIDSGLVGSSIFLTLAVFIAYLTENVIPTPADVVNSIVTFIFFSIFLIFECVFYKRAKGKKTEEKTQGIT